MVYGIIKLLNFAHGDIYMLGAFIGFACLGLMGGLAHSNSLLALLIILLVTMLMTGLVGVTIERVAYRPLRHAPRLSILITAVGVSFALEYGMMQLAGPKPRVYSAQLGSTKLDLFGARFTVQQLVLIGIAVVLMVGLQQLVMRSRVGRAMRAIALDSKTSLLMGINVNQVIALTFFLGSALAGAAGVMAGAYYGKIDFLMGFSIGLKAFTAAVIGGIGNIPGAMLGGLTLGLLESFGTHYAGGQWRDVFAFGFLILFLTIRPTGILGARVTERM
jgi:branched-chain amino acid transport system permease protein